MATVGRALLFLAFAVALYGIAASLYGGIKRERAWVDSGRRAFIALAGVLTIAFGILEAAFLRSDFSYALVASHSSTTTPTFYKATAVWSSQEGSLLLWVWLLSIWSSLVLHMTRRSLREIAPYAQAVLFGFATFFLFLTAFKENPFDTLALVPQEGTGLNPLLRHPAMMFHPPMLYSGYTLFSIPFAFAIGALVTNRVNAEWIQGTRRFALGAWLALGIGIVLGARWSYTELGWGGYWAWDPVENASLMPWLTGTAFIHSVMIQEKRGMLKVWNASLILATGTLAIMGTFLVRSGILDSIHAFGASTLGVPFLILISIMVLGSIGLVLWRREALRSEHSIDSLLSREAAFILQNILLVGLCFVIFWGTFFPLISEAVTGTKASVGPPWFDRYTTPIAFVLVALIGIGPLISWRRATAANLRRNLAIPLGAGAVTLVGLLFVSGATKEPKALVFAALVAIVLAGVGQELWRGTRARRAMSSESPPVALVSLVRRNRRRYGGYTVHAGFAILLFGVAISSSFEHSKDVSLRPGQAATIGGFDVRYVRAYSDPGAEKIVFGSTLDVSKDGKHVATLRTSRGFYPSQDPTLGILGRFFQGEAESEVGLRAGFGRDIWTVVNPDLIPLEPIIDQGNRRFAEAMRAVVGDGTRTPDTGAVNELFALRDQAVAALAERWVRRPWTADFRMIVSPMATWIWIGAIITFCGGAIALWPAPATARRRVTATYAARLAKDLARA
ncbi:heme lyase CcmF/NrfE family subunit [Conexibacter woesei]|uniref:Cytochrome c assembly protein n=1 Tax=Conexibacter woesei (strain DSM 14684 / CCUG 47730 / CIP 108061 / JCM 11494 / NBRC 100937 / ID131577) TaxID=469383 RepID=D3F7Z7_CONWI|nr:heme lyase CcmF/NrfE family subunit [Conexibacter woesei]ADB52891.1 cytochrome c assembly protein [Conexibacter woesei DSM 14684]